MNFTSQAYWICSSGCQKFHLPIQSETARCTDLMIYLHFSLLGFQSFNLCGWWLLEDSIKSRVDKQDKQLVTHSDPQFVYSEWVVDNSFVFFSSFLLTYLFKRRQAGESSRHTFQSPACLFRVSAPSDLQLVASPVCRQSVALSSPSWGKPHTWDQKRSVQKWVGGGGGPEAG